MSPQPPTSSDPPKEKYHGTPAPLHTAALVAAVVAPIGIFLPGRRGFSTFQNVFLTSGAFWAINQLSYDYTGKSVVERSNERWSKVLNSVSAAGDGLPTERAREVRAMLEAERRKREEGMSEAQRQMEQERRRKREADERGLLGKIWYGGEGADWKEKRMEEERQRREEGRGYGDLIWEQVKEAFGMDNKEGEKNKEGEEKKDGDEKK
ncbi:hypothetical protein OQA88_13597 [Cercophora sp. LCS_1]